MTPAIKYPPKRRRKYVKEGPHLRGSRYHAQMLFPDYTAEAQNICIDRLKAQAEIFGSATGPIQRRMLVRGLVIAAFTLNATAIWTAKLLYRGRFSMTTQRKFFQKRWKDPPGVWGENAKSCFARALAGYSIGHDSVCIDRHLKRVESTPKDAPEQWSVWFRTYQTLYGPGEARACIEWHTELLDWVARGSARPKPWK